MTGCASIPMASIEDDSLRKEFLAPEKGQAGIYIYRASIFFGDAVTKEIRLDENFIGRLKINTYLYQEVVEGNHILSTKTSIGFNEIELTFEGGKNYFLKQSYSIGAPLAGRATNLNIVSNEIGREEVTKYKLIEGPKQ